MAAARPLVSVNSVSGDANAKSLVMPAVFLAPIRPDIVQFVHTNMNKNNRQAYSVYVGAGHQHSAESWGTGRAVSRIPRVSGGGNSRSGQAAFGNMCRKGRMFAPTKTWRKWHRKINTNQKRYAVASALAASALPALVMGRGHQIDQVPEIPLVADDSMESFTRTKQAVAALKALGAYDDVVKSGNSRKLRRGKGKMRNRRHVQRRGPLVVYKNDSGIVQAFRNLPGVDLQQVERLNLLQLAPGGHLGRFIVWTQGAFDELNKVWGSTTRESDYKKGYKLPRARMTNSDISRIINSDEVQSKVRAAKTKVIRAQHKKNPLKNLGARVKLNPYALALRRSELLAQERRAAKKEAAKKGVRDAADKKKLAADKNHKLRQRANYQQIVFGEVLEAEVHVNNPQKKIKAQAAVSMEDQKDAEDPQEQMGSAMNFGVAEADLTHSRDNGGIDIKISCKDLIKMDWLSKSDPCVGVFVMNDAGEYEHYDQTEWKKNEHNPDFDHVVTIPSSMTGKNIRFNVYDVDDDSKVAEKDLMGWCDVIYSTLKESATEGKPISELIINDKNKLTGKKLKKAKSRISLTCTSFGTGFDLPKCLAYTKKFLADLNRDDCDAESFVAELKARWLHLDEDNSGLVSLDELRHAVWNGEDDNKGKPMPAGKFPPALQDIVDDIFKGTGSKPEFTYWSFVLFCLDDSLAIDDIDISAPDNSPWAHV